MLYRDRFRALRKFGFRLPALLRHIGQKLTALTVGRVFVSEWGKWARSAVYRSGSSYRDPSLKLAIVGHAYYPELITEILACRQNLPGSVSIHLTVPIDRTEAAEAQIHGIEGVILHPCDNRGRDIGPFIRLLSTGSLDGYDAVLKLHTKRSPHLLDGEIRRKLLFAMLCGDRRATARALAAFTSQDTGLVGWAACWRSASPYWMGNRVRVYEILDQMNASNLRNSLGFFEGSMFWFRPAAFSAIRELALSTEDFEAEEGQIDGTLHHALERCFTSAAWARGFVVRDLRGKILEPRTHIQSES